MVIEIFKGMNWLGGGVGGGEETCEKLVRKKFIGQGGHPSLKCQNMDTTNTLITISFFST